MLFVRAQERLQELEFPRVREARMHTEREFQFLEAAVERVGGIWNTQVRIVLECEKAVEMFRDARPRRA